MFPVWSVDRFHFIAVSTITPKRVLLQKKESHPIGLLVLEALNKTKGKKRITSHTMSTLLYTVHTPPPFPQDPRLL